MRGFARIHPWESGMGTIRTAADDYNQFLDSIFYNTSNLTAAERDQLSAGDSPDGSVVVVGPSGGASGDVAVRHFAGDSGAVVRGALAVPGVIAHGSVIIAIAGVGSSAFGTAAFARDIANFTGRMVIGVVTGDGMANAYYEALSGWYLFRATDVLDRLIRQAQSAFGPVDCALDEIEDGDTGLETLNALLDALPEGVRPSLAGHSRGNFLIEAALQTKHLDAERILTISAPVSFPDDYQPRLRQFLGSIDGFGGLNRVVLPTDIVPGAWHHTNIMLPPFALSVAGVLLKAGWPKRVL